MSKSVPTTISNTIKITKDCIYIGDILSASTTNGLADNIMILYLSNKVFSTVNKIDQPWNLVI